MVAEDGGFCCGCVRHVQAVVTAGAPDIVVETAL
jgi:hypothetical protein